MKNIIIIFVAGLLTQQIIQAQGTTYLSNLGQPSTSSEPVGSDSWLAAGFFTGNNVGGYVLNSVQLAMTDASGNPSDFTVMLYGLSNFTGGGLPGSSLGTLDGSANPATDNIYTYADDSNITLSPNTYYFIVLTAGTAVANGAYELSLAGANSYNPTGRWNWEGYFNSINGSSWSYIPNNFSQFAINATPVPEPSILCLLSLGGLALLWHRRKAKAA